jgi:tetratricopeptide (TPR) repeat protein
MKKIVFTFILQFQVLISLAQVNFPNPSPLQTIKQDVGMGFIELSYSRPSVRERKIIGHLEPYDSIWRLGANGATKILFSKPVEILGNKIDSGTYALYLIPSKKNWTLIVNKNTKNWGSDNYNVKDDVCRVELLPLKAKNLTETMAFQFENVRPESLDLCLTWEKWKLIIPIKTQITDELRKQIEANLQTENPIYWYAAQFYFEYDNNNQKALEMIDKAIIAGEKKGLKPYWYYHYKAKILKQLGKKQEAIEVAQKSYDLAKEHGNRNNYLKLNEVLIKSLK